MSADVTNDQGERQHHFIVSGEIDPRTGEVSWTVIEEGQVDMDNPIYLPHAEDWTSVSEDLQGADRLLSRELKNRLAGPEPKW
jgi:hypothetical protein